MHFPLICSELTGLDCEGCCCTPGAPSVLVEWLTVSQQDPWLEKLEVCKDSLKARGPLYSASVSESWAALLWQLPGLQTSSGWHFLFQRSNTKQLGLSLSPGAMYLEQCQERKPDSKALGVFLIALGGRDGGLRLMRPQGQGS